MQHSRSHLFAAIGFALAITLATSGPSSAQRNKGEDGTGGSAGYSPPIENPSGGAAMPDATAPMAAPPMPPPDSAGQAAPEENNIAAPEENKTAVPEENKKDDGRHNPD